MVTNVRKQCLCGSILSLFRYCAIRDTAPDEYKYWWFFVSNRFRNKTVIRPHFLRCAHRVVCCLRIAFFSRRRARPTAGLCAWRHTRGLDITFLCPQLTTESGVLCCFVCLRSCCDASEKQLAMCTRKRHMTRDMSGLCDDQCINSRDSVLRETRMLEGVFCVQKS